MIHDALMEGDGKVDGKMDGCGCARLGDKFPPHDRVGLDSAKNRHDIAVPMTNFLP